MGETANSGSDKGGQSNLVGQEQADDLESLLPAVDIVSQEKVVRLWREAPVLKESQQVTVLPVHIACGGGATQE